MSRRDEQQRHRPHGGPELLESPALPSGPAAHTDTERVQPERAQLRSQVRAAERIFRGESTFSADDLVAFRYRIIRLIAKGGMGEVYEAEDLELGERIALKMVRRERAEKLHVFEQLKREIYVARKVTHPNVCRIFDVGFHLVARGWDGREKRTPFFTMELLQGETLAARLKRTGPLDPAEAIPYIHQMIGALGAAHAAGIVHRDFKSANVFLESYPAPVGTSAGQGIRSRVVVTDFGLAKLTVRSNSPEFLRSGTGRLQGTPAYMAPEQIEGGPVSPATDIYALGVVMYEMLTGKRPFPGDASLGAAILRIGQTPPRPRSLRPELDRALEAAVLRCLSRDPAGRFASVQELALALPGRERDRRRWRQLAGPVLAGTTIALLAVNGFLGQDVLRLHAPSEVKEQAPSPSDVPRRRSIAILGFTNLSKRPESNWVATALSEVLATELAAGAAGESLRVSPPGAVARMKTDLALDGPETAGIDALGRVRKYLGCDLVVTGSYVAATENGASWRVQARVQVASTGQVVASATESGRADQMSELFAGVGRQLRAHLGVDPVAMADEGRVRRSLPRKPEAARRYAEGLSELRNLNAVVARERFEQAIALEPDHALSHAQLAEAFRQLGYGRRAMEEAKKAYELSDHLPREETLLVEGRYRDAAFEWDKSVEVYRTLFEFFPNNVEYGLALARAQQNSGRPEDAFATIAKLRELANPNGADLGIDEAEAAMATSVSDFPRAEAAMARAAMVAEMRGAWYSAAGNKQTLADIFAAQGKSERAREARRDAIALYERAGDRVSRADAVFASAREREDDGDFDAALRIYREVRDEQRGSGDTRTQALAAFFEFRVLWKQGRLREARRAAEQYVSIARDTGAPDLAQRLVYVADALVKSGDLDGASAQVEMALEAARAVHNQEVAALVLDIRADILRERGDPAAAMQVRKSALELARRVGSRRAIRWLEFTTAALVFDMGTPEAAERAASEQIASAMRTNSSLLLARAQYLRANALFELGDRERAKEAVDRAKDVTAGDQRMDLTLRARILDARLRTALSPCDARAAIERLEAIAAQAQSLGYFTMELEARLAAGEIELQFGGTAEARARLLALERDAHAKGYAFLARRAANARKKGRIEGM
ncbi:protein kinase domain-containing protein [Pendulispora albinea]|uniref:Protein kinase n=1 Tax=Pendulispora albinea TaxID=2741071 RepID=A0ABZ2M2R8_9BACT